MNAWLAAFLAYKYLMGKVKLMEPLCSQKWSEIGQKKWAQTENLFSEKSSTKTNKPPKTTETNKQKKPREKPT